MLLEKKSLFYLAVISFFSSLSFLRYSLIYSLELLTLLYYVMGGKRPANEYAFVLYTEEER
jgi:hypothetical protein